MGTLKLKSALLILPLALILLLQISDVSTQRLPLPALPGFLNSIRNILVPDNSAPRLPSTARYTYRRTQVLNATQGFVVTWESNRNLSTVTFNITAPLRGNGGNAAFVFGLSRKGFVHGSDVIVISPGRNGRGTAILDMFGASNDTISRDNNQSWTLLSSNIVQDVSIFVSVRRAFDTCDDQDIIINNDLVHLIYGTVRNANNISNSTRTLPFTADGSSRAYILDPIVPPQNSNGTDSFRITRRMTVPARRTSYWCTFHKGPSLQRKHHITRFTPFFGDDLARRHVHHSVIYRCIAPPTVDPGLIFERYINHPGEECYLEQRHRLPTLFCTEMVFTYGLGGDGFTFPDNVGLVLGETPNEYYMLETHYDNPESRADLTIEMGAIFQYTSQVRPVDGGLLLVGTGILGLHMVPPRSTEFPQLGQCGSECTSRVIPQSGMHVFGAMLHAHTYTRKIRMKHLRGNREFPYINADDNYDFSFQQIRHVPNASLVLPGDRLVVECIMDTSSSNQTVLSGFSTRDEMCVTFLIVNKRLPYLYCLSEYPTERTMERFGIQNITWHRELQERIINRARDQSLVGQTLSSAIRIYNWTPERRQELREQQNYGEHSAACPPVRRMAYQAYLAFFVEGLTAGVINQREAIENGRPSTRTVWTPKGPFLNELLMTRMPRTEVMRYIPPEPCTEIIPQRS